MTLKAILTDSKTGRALHTANVGILTTDPVLVVQGEAAIIGVWQSVNRTSAGTTTITTPVLNGSVIITDILISTTKTAMTDLLLQFTDGTETEVIFKVDTSNNPHAFGVTIRGRLQGWKNARIDMVTTGAVDATITLGYFKVPTGLDFKEWDARR